MLELTEDSSVVHDRIDTFLGQYSGFGHFFECEYLPVLLLFYLPHLAKPAFAHHIMELKQRFIHHYSEKVGTRHQKYRRAFPWAALAWNCSSPFFVLLLYVENTGEDYFIMLRYSDIWYQRGGMNTIPTVNYYIIFSHMQTESNAQAVKKGIVMSRS